MKIRQRKEFKELESQVSPKLKHQVVISPVDKVYNPDQDAKTLLRTLERTGDVKIINPIKLRQARKMYVKEFKSKEQIAGALSIDFDVLNRWIVAFGWDEDKEQEEFELYQKAANIRKKTVDTDIRHDRMFSNLETIVEDTIRQIMNNAGEYDIADIKNLAAIAKTCMESRRVIHKKEQGRMTVVNQIEDNNIMGRFQDMVADMVVVQSERASPKMITVDDRPAIPIRHEDVVEDLDLESEQG